MFREFTELQALNTPSLAYEAVFVPILQKQEWRLREISKPRLDSGAEPAQIFVLGPTPSHSGLPAVPGPCLFPGLSFSICKMTTLSFLSLETLVTLTV